LFDGRVTYCLNVKNNNLSPIFQLCFVEGMDMTTNIPEDSADPMVPTTQQAPGITISSFISSASAIPDGIQLHSAISARSSTILVDLAIPEATLVPLGILDASSVPPPISPHFTHVAPIVLTPTTPILAPVPRQTIVSLA
jgi:hypothetical protein